MIAHIRTFSANAGKIAWADHIRTCLLANKMGVISHGDCAIQVLLALDNLHPYVLPATDAERLECADFLNLFEDVRTAFTADPEWQKRMDDVYAAARKLVMAEVIGHAARN